MDFCLIKPKIQILKKKNLCLIEIMEEFFFLNKIKARHPDKRCTDF